MQNNRKEIEVKNNGIDLTETATFGKNKKYDDPFHPDSEGYWLFKVPNNEKLRILLEKVNQNDGYFRFHSIDHIVETIFNSSNGQFLTKKRYAEKRINDIPEIKQQYVIDEKLKTFNEIEELKKVLKGIEPSEDCFLDLDQSKEVLIEYTFPPLGFKTVKEIEIYLLSLIAYRGNLLYINYLKQLSAPTPKAEAQGNDKPETTYPNIVVMAVAQIIHNVKGEAFLPEETNYKKRVEQTKTAIYKNMKITVGNGIGNFFNPFEKLTSDHRKQVAELLRSLGYTPQAKEFELKNVATNR